MINCADNFADAFYRRALRMLTGRNPGGALNANKRIVARTSHQLTRATAPISVGTSVGVHYNNTDYVAELCHKRECNKKKCAQCFLQ